MDTTHCHPFSRDTIGSDKGYFWVLSPCFTISFYWLKRGYPAAQAPLSDKYNNEYHKNRGKRHIS